jgi:hypothetical protein
MSLEHLLRETAAGGGGPSRSFAVLPVQPQIELAWQTDFGATRLSLL